MRHCVECNNALLPYLGVGKPRRQRPLQQHKEREEMQRTKNTDMSMIRVIISQSTRIKKQAYTSLASAASDRPFTIVKIYPTK